MVRVSKILPNVIINENNSEQLKRKKWVERLTITVFLGKGSHMSLFFVVMKGEYDALLPWPFRQKVRWF